MTTVTHSVLGKGSSCLVVEDGAPTYAELLAERDRLLKLNAKLVGELSKKAVSVIDHQDLWACIEDVAMGAKLDCPKCGKVQPCMCGHES